MTPWEVKLLDEAKDDLRKLDNAARTRVIKAMRRVAQNPLPQAEGGYGKPLGNRDGTDLAGFMKVKLKADGIRIVYTLKRIDEKMLVVVVGARSDNDVYREAQRRRKRHNL